MTGVVLSVSRYDWCAPLQHAFSCMLVNHGPKQQSSKEEYKPWQWGATADTTHLIQGHLARHSERGKKTRQTEEEVGRKHQKMDRPWIRQVPKGSGEQGKLYETGCEIICYAPTTLAVKGIDDDECNIHDDESNIPPSSIVRNPWINIQWLKSVQICKAIALYTDGTIKKEQVSKAFSFKSPKTYSIKEFSFFFSFLSFR